MKSQIQEFRKLNPQWCAPKSIKPESLLMEEGAYDYDWEEFKKKIDERQKQRELLEEARKKELAQSIQEEINNKIWLNNPYANLYKESGGVPFYLHHVQDGEYPLEALAPAVKIFHNLIC